MKSTVLSKSNRSAESGLPHSNKSLRSCHVRSALIQGSICVLTDGASVVSPVAMFAQGFVSETLQRKCKQMSYTSVLGTIISCCMWCLLLPITIFFLGTKIAGNSSNHILDLECTQSRRFSANKLHFHDL